MASSIYELKLNELFIVDNNISIHRVPGGWIHMSIAGSCFIPYSEEFKEGAQNTAESKIYSAQHIIAELSSILEIVENESNWHMVCSGVYTITKLRELLSYCNSYIQLKN